MSYLGGVVIDKAQHNPTATLFFARDGGVVFTIPEAMTTEQAHVWAFVHDSGIGYGKRSKLKEIREALGVDR